jgi:hypothetical protein
MQQDALMMMMMMMMMIVIYAHGLVSQPPEGYRDVLS